MLFSGQGPIADVVAILHAGPVYDRREAIGLALRGADRVSQTHRAQYPSAIGDHRPILICACRGVEDFARQLRRGVKSGDHIAS